MKTFDDFKVEKEKHEIATLICDLGIDPDAYFEQVISEGIFKKMGDWWKKNVSAPNTVRLKSSYDQAQQAVDKFITNFYALRKQGHMPQSSSGLNMAISRVKQNLDMMKDQVDQVDQHAQQGVANMPYGDIGSWDNDAGPSMAQKGAQAAGAMGAMAQQGGDMVKQGVTHMGQKFGDWRNQRNWKKLSPFEKGLKRMKNQNGLPTDI